jgi:hypothetical protein
VVGSVIETPMSKVKVRTAVWILHEPYWCVGEYPEYIFNVVHKSQMV